MQESFLYNIMGFLRMNKIDFQQLTEIRVKKATCLIENGYYDGAYYLLGGAFPKSRTF